MFEHIPSFVTSIISFVLGQRKTIARLLKRTIKKLTKGELTIMIIGSGGTGKTTLADFLRGRLPDDYAQQPYLSDVFVKQESLETERLDKDSCLVTLMVAPGQLSRLSQWPEMFTTQSRNRTAVLINVCSWGYAAPDDATSPEDFEEYLRERRERELQVLEQAVLPELPAIDKPVRFLTVISKQDLWWDKRRDVESYYRDGAYGSMMSRLHEACRGGFSHELTEVCFVIRNLKSDRDGKELARTVGGYGQDLQHRSWVRLFEHVNAIARK